jgi:hypothetical protein
MTDPDHADDRGAATDGGTTTGDADAGNGPGGRPAVALFRAMVREEWRLHAELFGGGRFAGFPLAVFALAAVGVELLVRVGTSLDAAILGLHALVAFVGLQTGTVGLVSRDAIDSLVGDVTFLLTAATTLPIRRRDVLAVFLAKDLLYYAGYFLAPLALALVPAVLRGTLAPTAVPRLWLSSTLTFVTGSAVTLAGVALSSRGRIGRAVLSAVAIGVAALVVASALGTVAVDLARYTPYALYAGPATPVAVVTAVGPTALLAAVGVYGVDPTYRRPARSGATDGSFERWRARLGGDGLLVKTLLDVRRSDGGFLKVAFSALVVLAVAVALVTFAGRVTGVPPAPGVSVGALLGLSAFTTYNWLASFDSVDAYRHLPVSVADVFRAKLRAFLLLGPAVGLGTYLLAVVWLRPAPADVVAGAGLVVALQVYLYGVTTYVAGLRPNEFLFDPVLFAGFTLAVAVVLVPVLLVALAVPTLATRASLVAPVCLALGGLGLALARRAPRRWRDRAEGARG